MAVDLFNNKFVRDWEIVKLGAINKIENFLNTGNSSVMFSKKEYMQYYT
jgi:hypothetical protein